MFCRFCGAALPDDSTFCQSCGKSQVTNQASTAAAAPAPALAPSQAQPKSKGARTGFTVVLLIVLAFLLWSVFGQKNNTSVSQSRPFTSPQTRIMPLVDTAFTLNAGQGMHWNFTVPASATNVQVEGTFTASGGTGNDVEVYLLNDDEFVNWQNHHSVSTLYNSGRMTQATVSATLPSGGGTYHLVFNNQFSLLSPKAVKASIRLHYTM